MGAAHRWSVQGRSTLFRSGTLKTCPGTSAAKTARFGYEGGWLVDHPSGKLSLTKFFG